MAKTKVEPELDQPDEQLDRAIEELRGVLHEEEQRPEMAARAAASANSSVIMNIPVDVQIILGSTEMAVADLMALQKGSTVALNRRIGEPVDVVVNGRKIARGEITVLESDPSRFGIRLTEIIAGTKGA
ncbi:MULTISPECIES: flagellar motor switch protein FliN [unclassified Mesorhizobium]|uniref:flagellar motor switch protein FliN n=1 Tax=unclassified Mesorhizobium TaxID=325217 RepID=UPI000F75165A|nr:MULTISPECIES: flagellar motor switch protein FliN [unclassified Mesorhizobium]RUX02722.1 flagellar motor switch protein FliN [Mesorhizobium sp. M8A.F.Ca.ET.059.01.1.1]RUX03144.1 flagellar motor switch protein FliN [Mesorhizobium sp. M8A.F.Ca.ET.023.01.1.1]TGR48792.1 flagellar motor switch protein FliN [bacterium M00.F.Ca.ET.199.01.1.1]TGU37833.1 flagellar motor switch protein FliN [bacterium M00.F.Ca.ET.156.01.1.1]TGU96781.1 flagellar motor switch protein FliN [Mesorhizobium sp. M00.F.Ca.ET